MTIQVNENLRLWAHNGPYSELDEYDVFAREVHGKFPEAKVQPVAYSGGVPGMQARLKTKQYEDAKAWLTERFGPPIVKEPWVPTHTKGVPPLEFKKTPEMVHQRMYHVNLISMMQHKSKRYVLMSWM